MGVIEDFVSHLQGQATYDPVFEAAKRAALLRGSDLSSQYDVGMGNIGADYDMQKYLLDRGLDQSLLQGTDKFGGQGTIHSSAYAMNQGETNQRFQDMLAQAAQRRTSQEANLAQALK